MFKLSDATGKLTFSQVSQGSLEKSKLDSADVFLVDNGIHLYVWVGNGKMTFIVNITGNILTTI